MIKTKDVKNKKKITSVVNISLLNNSNDTMAP